MLGGFPWQTDGARDLATAGGSELARSKRCRVVLWDLPEIKFKQSAEDGFWCLFPGLDIGFPKVLWGSSTHTLAAGLPGPATTMVDLVIL